MKGSTVLYALEADKVGLSTVRVSVISFNLISQRCFEPRGGCQILM